MFVLLAFLSIHHSFIWVSASDRDPVTCGSGLKLLNVDHNVRLHSYDVQYGSGSGQQSVTGVSDAIDSGSYWQIMERNGSPRCVRGRAIKCGQKIRLMHLNSRKNLHSHHFQSPLTPNYEVSAFGDDGKGDEGDDWQVLCDGQRWLRDTRIRLKHISTEGYLTVSGKRYNRPISGAYEVCGMPKSTSASYWMAADGIFIKPPLPSANHNGSDRHDEL